MLHKAKMLGNGLFQVAWNGLICGVLFKGILLFQSCFPVAYNYFVSEDSWVEYGTFVCYLLAGFLVLRAIKIDQSTRRLGYILLCLGLFFIAMEEISWGQRLFGIRTPHIIAQFNQQSELSLHNVSFFQAEHLFFYAILIWAIILPEISYRVKRFDAFLKVVGIPLVSREIYPYFILGFFLKNFEVVIQNAEIGEFFIGLAFVLFAVDTYFKTYDRIENIYRKKGQLIGWAITVLLIATTLIVLLGPQDIYALKWHLQKSAITEYPRFGMNAQAQKIFEYLVRHEELKNDDTLFQYGLFLKRVNRGEAEAIFEKTLKEAREHMLKTPDKPAPNILAGKILKELNQLELAQKEFDEALRKNQIRLIQAELNWQKMDALKSMGETYIEMEKYDLAREHLQKAFDYAEGGWAKARIKDLLEAIGPQ